MTREAARVGPSSPPAGAEDIRQRFTAALEPLIHQIKADRSVLAAILCGSLSHDAVWAKSDIDLVLVTVDDKKVDQGDLSLYADGLNVHTLLFPRASFRRIVEGSMHGSFVHSFLAKGRLLYAHDPTVAHLCAALAAGGGRDRQLQLLRAATHIVPPMYKARKWLVTRGDLEYTALWILYAATGVAQAEVIAAGLLPDREVIPQAAALKPALFKTIYADLLNTKKTRATVQAALGTVEAYLKERAPVVFGAIIEYLREVGEARSCRELEDYFSRNFDIEGVTTACEYLADQGLIGKASTSARLTKKSNVEVQELAFYDIAPAGRP